MVPRVIGTGNDKRGLGRWAWTRLRGKDRAITIISAYRPCKPSTSGVQTVYQQHLRALPVHQEPRQQFLVDLKECIQEHQAQGDNIILGIDLNDPAQRYDINKFFEELNMKEAIQSLHCGQRPPVTNILNDSEYPIDGIWCSIGLTATRAGYSKFREGIPSDHRVLWVEFVLQEVFGSSDKINKKVTLLKASDPRDIMKYIHRIKKEMKIVQCLDKMKELQAIITDCFTPLHEQQYNKLLKYIIVTRKHIKHKLRHVFRGEVEWSPKYKLTKDVKRLWDQLRKYRKGKVTGKRISLTSIRRLMRQTKLHKALESTMGEIEVKLREAKKDFRDIKKMPKNYI